MSQEKSIVPAKSQEKTFRALEVIEEIIEGSLNLKLYPEKTLVMSFGEEFVFLGYEFINWRFKGPRQKAQKWFKDRVREATRSQQPWHVERIIGKLISVICG